MNKIIKVPFNGNEIVAVEKDGKVFVALKPIAEALELDWSGQLKLIKKDEVLSSGMVVTSIPSTDGGVQDMACLQLEYLNGWLFKIPAIRYSGKKKEAIVLYQKECYKVLYDYWHNGGAVNPRLSEEQATTVIKKVATAGSGRFDENVIELLKKVCSQLEQTQKAFNETIRRNVYLENFHPKGIPYELSRITGRPKDRFVSGYYSSNCRARLFAALALMPELPWGEDYAF